MPSHNEEIQAIANEAMQAALHEAECGQTEKACELYSAVLDLLPGHPQAHFGLGLLAYRNEGAAAAIPHYASALQGAPEEEHYWLAYLKVLMEARQFATARELIELGREHGLQGPGIDAAERQLATDSAPSEQEMEAATALYTGGKKDAARILAQKFTERFPQHPFGWKLLGGVLYSKRAYPEALEAMRKAAIHGPDDAETLRNLGLMLRHAGSLEEARSVLERAVAADPRDKAAYNHLAATLHEMGLLTQALASANAALALDPDHLDTISGLATILDNLGRSGEAIDAYRRVLAQEPDQVGVHGNMLFCMSHMESFTPKELFDEHLRFGRRLEARLGKPAAWHPSSEPERQLRIGFVSGDLRNHAIATFVGPLFRELAKRPGLSLHVYYNHPLHDATTALLRSHIAHWRDVVTLEDAALDALIRGDGIDILIDLSGHTAYNRLPVFARKPAPLQVTWLGYPGTTGMSTMDYFFCDRYLAPPGQHEQFFTEALARLPVVVPFEPATDAPEVGVLPALANGYVTFGSFNRLSKINLKVLAVWSRLLRALPDSRLLLAGMPAGGGGQEQLQAWLREEGIDPARTSFHQRTGTWDYLNLHKQVDICLDTFPYTGGTSSLYALHMGVPTLTLASESLAGRQTACILKHHKLEQFVAHDADDFVQKGVAASKDLATLASIRSATRDHSPMWSTSGILLVADGFEQALRLIWRRWCAGLPPASFEVQPVDSHHDTKD